MSPRRALPVLLGAAVLVVVLWRTGTGPVVTGLRSLDAGTLALGALLAGVTTVASAWRWRLVARGLGVELDLGTAVASCYGSQLLNTTLPGGVLGDLHRGVRHGRDVGATALALRAVVWERAAGQVVQAVLAVGVLALLPSPVQDRVPGLLGLGLVGLVLAGAVAGTLAPRTPWLDAARTDVRRGLLAAWPGVVLASTVAVAGYVATYLLAARAVGVTTPTARLLPLVLLVLVAAGLPFNVAGWGPREGMAAWAFGAAGSGAASGLATAVAYGALVLVGSLPGLVALVVLARPRAARLVGTGATRG